MIINNIILIIIVSFVIVTNFCTDSFPIVIAPKEFRVNVHEEIVVISGDNEGSGLDNERFTIEITDFTLRKNVIFNASFSTSQDEPLRVPIKINTLSSSGKVTMSVISESGERRESIIKLIPKSGYAFIQSDKPIYTPKESVKIRMIRVDENLRPLTENIKLRIKNSQKIIVEETQYTPKGPYYFVDHKFNFPPAPKLGLWNAEVLFGPNFTANYSVEFEVREYVLPTFSAKLKSPKIIVPTSEYVNGSVTVNYVYGKPVEGSVTFKFGVKEPNGKVTYIGRTDLKQLNNGSASYHFATNQFRQFAAITWFPVINGHRFVVEASVHERVTGKKDKVTDDSGLFVNSPYIISFKNAFNDFKPDIETFVAGQVLDVFGDPVPDIPVSLHLIDERGISIVPKYISPQINSSQMHTDLSGRVSLPITLKKGVEELHVTLRTIDPKYTREEQAEGAHLLRAHESYDGLISIVNRDKYSTSLSVGDVYQSTLTIRGAIIFEKMFLLILNRGRIMRSEKISTDGKFKINIEENMTPNIRVVVFALSRENKVVSDSLKINVAKDHCGFDLKVKNTDSKNLRPGADVKLVINGTIGDSIALLGVDEAVYILRNKDRLTKKIISREIGKSDHGCGPGGGRNTFDVFDNAGLKLITIDSDISDDKILGSCQRTVRVKREASVLANQYHGKLKKCCVLGMMPSNRLRSCQHKANIVKVHMPRDEQCINAFLECCKSNYKPNVQASVAATALHNDRTRIGQGTEEYVHVAYEEELESKALVRKDFRETWLFDLILLSQSSVEHNVTLPHSITTWSVTGMSLSPKTGLCLMDSPIRILSFQPIFLQIAMPYTVVQNEQIEILATVFNYGTERKNILIYTYGIEDICSEVDVPGQKSKKNLAVDANSATTVAFPMVPLRSGKYELKFAALWTTGSDVVVKTLTVVPPGVPVEDDFTFQLDPLNRQKRKKRAIVTPRLNDEIDPENSRQITQIDMTPSRDAQIIVPNTKECILAAIADQFGATAHTTLNDIDQLIRQPKGCGEQTMLFLAPTLYTLKYLESIDRLTGDLRFRGMKYLKDGYKRELSFRKDDGSFSAFPIRPSSIWLTAFVMKVFCQSHDYLQNDGFDPHVIKSGINWILKQQNNDGSWTEQHPVIHEAALGGVQGTVPLTAYVLITLHECDDVVDFNSDFKIAMNKSESYLIKNQNAIIQRMDTYSMGLVAYSLAFNQNSRNTLKLVEALHSYSNTDNARNFKYWRNSYEVEATSYALMAILKSGFRSSIDALSVANWLNSRRSFTGSFDTTQDTIVALEALTQFVKTQIALPEDSKLNCNITSSNKRFKKSISFHKDNALILQKFKADSAGDILEFNTHGNGHGLMSVKLKYHVLDSPENLCRFDIDINVSEWKDLSRNEDNEEADIGEDFFNDFPEELVKELDIKNNKRKKRSLFWNGNGGSLRQSLDRFRSGLAETTIGIRNVSRRILSPFSREISSEPKLSNIGSNHMNDYQKNNLSVNQIAGSGVSKLVLLLEICVRHIPRQNSEMSIVDVGILSGYVANKDDLDEIINTRDSLVSKYEKSDRNIVFYLDTVPFGRPYCFQFRIIREHIVSNTQSAILRVYDYYKSDHSCTQLYSPTRIGALIETKCNSSVCKCAKRKNCPNAISLIEIGKIYEKKVARARELFEELICDQRYHFVFGGHFIQQNNTRNGFKLMRFRVDNNFKGNATKGDIFWLTLNGECDDIPIDMNKDALIFGQINDQSRHLSGSSILFFFGQLREDSPHRNIHYLKIGIENKLFKGNFKCAQ